MALAQGACAQGTHAPASTGSCLAGSLGLRTPRVRLLGSAARPSEPSLDAHPCLVSWSQHSGGAESTDSLQLPSGQMPAMLSGQQLLRGWTLCSDHWGHRGGSVPSKGGLGKLLQRGPWR